MVEIRALTAAQVPSAAALVARLQRDPAHHIGYYGEDAAALEAQIRATAPAGLAGAVVAHDGRRPVGFLQAEWDAVPPRVWWHGPLVDTTTDWDAVADTLYDAARGFVPPEAVEEELCPDARNHRVAAFGGRHGFQRRPASAVLSRGLSELDDPAPPPGVAVHPPTAADRAGLVALHDALFPATHTPGARLGEGVDRLVLVAARDGEVCGYVAAERQPDGDAYLDYLGVAADHRGTGIGRHLVVEACARLRAAHGCRRAHLTVREDNAAARRLYAALDFREERLLVPWRRGFDL